MINKDLNPKENDIIKEAMVWFVIKASLHDLVDDIIETNLGVKPVR